MSAFGTFFAILNGLAILLLPLRWAALPLLVGACYMTLGQGIEVGALSFPVIRLLIAAGVLRAVLSGKGLAGGVTRLDRWMLAWAIWAVASSVFHADVPATLVGRLGLVYNACGVYFLLRVFCRSVEDVFNLCRITAILMIPLALAMVLEQATGRNLFAALGGVSEYLRIAWREDPCTRAVRASHSGRIRGRGVAAPDVRVVALAWTPFHRRHRRLPGDGRRLSIERPAPQRRVRARGLGDVAMASLGQVAHLVRRDRLPSTRTGDERAGVLPDRVRRSHRQQYELASGRADQRCDPSS